MLAQSIRPDHLWLWIAETDFAALPEAVTALQADGLEIRTCDDLRSYKKIIPALVAGHDCFLLVADDDVYYRRRWLKDFVCAFRPGRKNVLCGRAHGIRVDVAGMPLPYLQWQPNVPQGEPSRLLFPTGIGGVLYEPGIFHRDVTRADLFQRLCPDADDIWLFWMASLNGAQFQKVGPRSHVINWPNSQKVALFGTNYEANDSQIANMVAEYGFPGGE